MRKFLFLPLLALLAACGKDEDCDKINPKPEGLVTSALYATLTQTATDPYNGPLEVLACQPGSSIYVGNYMQTGKQTPVPAYYSIVNGAGNAQGGSPLRLPSGSYSIIYWGYPLFFNTPDASLTDPSLILGGDLSGTSMGLRRAGTDTVYYPAHDLVFGTQTINIGEEDLQANLTRATSALGVVATEANGNPFSTAIDSMWIYIGGIYSNLNYYTAQPQGSYRTVRFGMSPNSDRTEWSEEFVSLFPSQPSPLLQLFVQFKDGTVKSYKQNLTRQLNAGTKTTVSLSMDGQLLEQDSTGGFQVDKWKEQNDSISIPLS